MPYVIGAVIILGVTGYWLAKISRWARNQWFLVRLARFFLGAAHHGKPVTDAGWFRRGQNALTRTGHATRWWYLPQWQRALHRIGGFLGVFAWMIAALVNWQATALATGAVLLAGLAWFGWWLARHLRDRKLRRTFLHPLHLRAHQLAEIPRAQRAASWIKAELDPAGAVRKVTLELPPGWAGDEREQKQLVAIASSATGIQSAVPKWRLAGPVPLLTLIHSPPPPGHVTLTEMLPEMAKGRHDQLLIGVGRNGELVWASLATDSPHIAISMGSGAGKSNLAGFLLLQMLLRGSIGQILDAKRRLSYPWLLKDADRNLAQLPCIAYAWTTAQIHESMAWLSTELDRRGDVAFAGMDTGGKVHANVGPRLFTIAEELNLAIPRLREHWAEQRPPGAPAKSPAFTGLGGVAFAGRQVHKHLILVGQMLTAEATGSRDSSVKENCGIKLLARYGAKGWRIMADDIPMPPPPTELGRVQVVTASGVELAQTPELDPWKARALVLASDMAALPSGPQGMPCRPVLPETVTAVPELEPWPDLRRETVSVTRGPSPVVTLKEAVESKRLRQGTTVGALKMARFRDKETFPADVGKRGTAKLYDLAALVKYDVWRAS